MSNIGMEYERNQNDTPPVQHITTVVDVEITRHRLKTLIKRLEEGEADLAPDDVVLRNIDELFDENGEVKYFKKPAWTDEELASEFHVPFPDVKRFLEMAYPNYCYEDRVCRRNWALTSALMSLGCAYQKQKRQFAELKDSYDALKAHANKVNADPLNDEDCPKCKKLRSELIAEQIHTASATLRASSLERKVNELLEELSEAKIKLEVAEKAASFWDKIFPICIVCGLSIAFVAAVVSLIFS